ncbi:macrolide family glycosyltransferase [Paenibacillus humicola]|uniref:macrolide family glycosyltransferase n=1 Tax=Paenibacillus humicola TaxID=3110540 RepID=UPI00237C3177|nr:macrolide family glycosyltransferase [Paenibacillus humicola]
MGKMLFINFPGEGHINPTVGLVKELTARGEEITYYCAEKYKARMEGAGASVRTYDDFVERELAGKIAGLGTPGNQRDPLMFLEFMLRKSLELYEWILPQVEQERYDYVVYDHVLVAGWMIAEKLKLPRAASCTTFAFHPEWESPMRNMISEDKIAELQIKIKDWVERAQAKYGLDLSFLNSRMGIVSHPVDMTIVYTSTYFQPKADKFDGSFHFVGPSIAPRSDAPELPLQELKGRKVVFVSMGTVFNQQKAYYDMCFEAFKDLDAAIVMSVGRNTDIHAFSSIPDNFIVRNYVPQLDVLQIADVFFTHGGMNSSSEGLYYDTPLAVAPVSADQPMVARRVSELGAGIALNLNEITPALLRETAEKLLSDPSYKRQAEKIGASFREAGGAAKAADLIMQWRHASAL